MGFIADRVHRHHSLRLGHVERVQNEVIVRWIAFYAGAPHEQRAAREA
jgi:hypothetical protein